MTGKTFFSYSRADSSFVLKLAKDLRDSGVDLWLDQLDIKPGSRWDASIESALDMANRMVVVLSTNSINSNNVMDEVSFALESNKDVIPVLLNECKVPFRLKRLQHIDFTGNYEAALNQLLDVLGYSDGLQKAEREGSQPQISETITTPPPEAHYSKDESRDAEAYTAIRKTESSPRKQPAQLAKKETTFTAVDEMRSTSKKYYFIGVGILVTALIIWIVMHSGQSISGGTAMKGNNVLNAVPEKKPENKDNELKIGIKYGGGIVFYIDSTGEHGLIAAPKDFTDYDKDFKEPLANLCASYKEGGYSDWRLPTAKELRLLYDVRNSIDGLYLKYGCCDPPVAYYYSSDTNAKGEVLGKGFASGTEDYRGVGGGRVRAVRSF